MEDGDAAGSIAVVLEGVQQRRAARRLLLAEQEIDARRIPEVISIADSASQQTGQARQVVIRAQGPECDVFAELDVEASARHHSKTGVRSVEPRGDWLTIVYY